MIDFNKEIIKELPNEYTGSEKKKTVILSDGKQYLLKLPDPTRDKRNNLSYINNALSEYIGCKIVKSIGLDVQNVLLGTYITDEGKFKIACACEDVRSKNEYMSQISTLNLSYPEGKREKAIKIDTVEKFASNNPFVNKKDVLDFFYNQMIADALIGNPDRHTGNWGILTDRVSGKSRMSPIFDCGSCLNSLADDNHLNIENINSIALNSSYAILKSNGNPIILYHYINSLENEQLNSRILDIMKNINLNEINHIIDSIECISSIRKNYYKKFIDLTYNKILLSAYKKIQREKILSNKQGFKNLNYKKFYNDVLKELYNLPLYENIACNVEYDIINIRRISNKDFILLDAEAQNNYIKIDSSHNLLNLSYKNLTSVLSDKSIIKLEKEFCYPDLSKDGY